MDDLRSLLELGERNRATATTLMNASSSRSHAALIVTISYPQDPTQPTEQPTLGTLRESSSLVLVDLAGSERSTAAGGHYTRLEEAKAINLSLSALGNCMSALAEGRSHVPYRDSKLTRLLQGSLGYILSPQTSHNQTLLTSLSQLNPNFTPDLSHPNPNDLTREPNQGGISDCCYRQHRPWSGRDGRGTELAKVRLSGIAGDSRRKSESIYRLRGLILRRSERTRYKVTQTWHNINPNLTQLNPNLSQLNPNLTQLNPNLSQLNPNLAQLTT